MKERKREREKERKREEARREEKVQDTSCPLLFCPHVTLSHFGE
jgi:hypothetical protein